MVWKTVEHPMRRSEAQPRYLKVINVEHFEVVKEDLYVVEHEGGQAVLYPEVVCPLVRFWLTAIA